MHRIDLVGTIAAACVLAACSSYRMGDPIVAKPAKSVDASATTNASAETAAPAKSVANATRFSASTYASMPIFVDWIQLIIRGGSQRSFHGYGSTIAIFRIPGAWEDEGYKILERYGVEYADRSVSMHEAARRAVEKIQGAAA